MTHRRSPRRPPVPVESMEVPTAEVIDANLPASNA